MIDAKTVNFKSKLTR